MNVPTYSLKKYFDHKNTPCLSFNVYDLENLESYSENVLHRNDYFQVIFLDDGILQQQIEHNTYDLSAKTISIVFPHQITSLQNQSNPKGFVIQFDEVLFCSDLLKNELIAYNNDLIDKLNYVELGEEKHQQIREYAEQIKLLFEDLSPIKKEQIRFFIKIMLLEIIESAHQNINGYNAPDQLDHFAKFKTLIESNFIENRTVTFYAEQLQMTTKKLNNICKNKTGITALQLIHERILVEIKRLLLFSGKNHKEIAFSLGFDSPSALNKFVYAKLKETPSELKEELSRIYKY
jgi:AraC family transcriptional activator of pobA